MDAPVRFARCPRCERQIRLTEPELADKRGFCALCDAHFELRPGLLAPLPYRRQARAELALAPEPPPAHARVRTDADSTTITLRHGARWPGLLLAPLCAAGWLSFPTGVLLTLAALVLSLVTAWFLVGKEELVLDGQTLLWRRAVGPLSLTASVATTEIHDVVPVRGRDRRAVALIRASGQPLLVGKSLDLGRDVHEWLARRLRGDLLR